MWKHLVQWDGNHDAEQAGMAKQSGVWIVLTKNRLKTAKSMKMAKIPKDAFSFSLWSNSPVKNGLKKGL